MWRRFVLYNTIKLLALISLFLAVSIPSGSEAQHSDLWGANGEKWSPASRLPDFSRAGYHNGERSIPDVPTVSAVTQFGAVGDGKADDTDAFLRAIEETESGTILVPAGRYVITARLRITKPNVVLRGEGEDKTFLVIPRSLQQLQPSDGYTALGVRKLHYSFGSAFLEMNGRSEGARIGKVTAPSRRGDRTLVCEETGSAKVGDWILLKMTLNADLGRHIHGGQDAGEDTLARPRSIEWVARVEAVEGNRLVVDRPLRIDVRPEWGAVVHRYEPTVYESGVEGLTFEFPGVEKKRHLLEEGFNGIQFNNVANCWVRNVRFIDADMGIKVGRARFCQIEDVAFVEAKRTGRTGHHAIWAVSNSQECLFQRFRVETTYIHDLTVEGFAHGNVFRDGSGRSLNLDHHRNGPYENLFTNLDVGNPKRMWASSGRGDRGPHSGARTTAWNLRHDGGEVGRPRKPKQMFPQINIIGVAGYEPEKDPNGIWVEPLGGTVIPPDLYQAQRNRRLTKAPK